MILITELQDENLQCITEGAEGAKKTYITGPYIIGAEKNKNGRYYMPHVLEREVNRYIKEHVMNNSSLGELNHPATPAVNPERACHLIKELKRDGDRWIGKSQILESVPLGKLVKGLIDEGVRLGVSTRGVGTLKEDRKLGAMVVQEDFNLATVDVVSNPSGPGCFVNGIMEGAEWIYEASTGSWKLAEQIKSNIKKMTMTEAEKYGFVAFNQFIKSLGGK